MNSRTKLSLVIAILLAVIIVIAISIPPSTHAAGPWYVATTGNDGNTCLSAVSPCATINGALGKAAPGDTVLVATGTYTGTGTEVVSLNISTTLSGGWNSGFTSQTDRSRVDGQGARRGIKVNVAVTAIVERFAIQNGFDAFPGGGIYNDYSKLTLNNSTVSGNVSKWLGGGIVNYGTMTISNATISGNTASGGDGGGIENIGTLILNNSTVSGNTILGSYAGSGIYNDAGTLTLNNSTVSSNTQAVSGGGIYNLVGPVTLNNSTVSDNTAYYDGGGIFMAAGTVTLNNSTISGNSAGNGGGIFEDGGSVTLQNSILAGNTSSWISLDCSGTINSSGYNLIGNTAGCTFTPGAGDLTNVDAELGPLQDNGGPTPTQAPFPGSPAINAGNPGGCLGSAGLLTTDQRGMARFGRCDMGAYELQPLDYSTKTVNPSTSAPSQPLTYTIALTNGGASTLTNIFVTDTLPINLTYHSNSLIATGGTYGFSSGIITWTGSLNADGLVTVTFGAIVNQTAPLNATITNSAVIRDGGEILIRTASVNIPPAEIYLPLVTRNYCTGPFYTDDFSNPASGWPVGNSASVQYGYLSGEYRLLVKNTYWGIHVSPGLKASDYIVSVDVRNATGVYGSYGLLFGLSDDFSQFYDLEIDPLGNYAIFQYGSGTYTVLAQGSSGSINTGTASNRIKIERNGAQIKAYANGQLLTSISDGSYTGLRRVGLIAFSYAQHNVDVRFDNFKVYDVACESIATSLSLAGPMMDGAALALNGESGNGTMKPGSHLPLNTLPADMGLPR